MTLRINCYISLTQLLLLPLPINGTLLWSRVTPSTAVLPPVRRDTALGFHANLNQLVLFGGRGSTIYSDTWMYDLTSNIWRQVSTPIHPAARFSFVSGVSGDFFYVATGEGRSGGGRVFFNDIWRFHFINETWDELPTGSSMVQPNTRYGSAGGVLLGASTFYIALGFDLKRYSDVFSYDLTDMHWTEEYRDRPPYNPSYPHARCLHSGTMIASSEFIIFGGCLTGGSSGGPCPAGDSWRFHGASREWTKLMACAEPRAYSTMALLPQASGQLRVVLYGGSSSRKQTIQTDAWPEDEVAVFNPSGNKWSLKKVSGSVFPERRQSAVMVTANVGIYMFGGAGFSSGVLNDLWLLAGNSSGTDQLQTSRDCAPFYFSFVMLHGVFMFIGWGVLLQAGVFVARYIRFKDPLWFHLHRVFQSAGLVLSFLGFIFAFMSVEFDHMKFAHAQLGLVIMIIGIQQPFNALIRPHKKADEPKSGKRWIWEKFHRILGRTAQLLALINITLGVFLANASTAVYVSWLVYFALLLLAFAIAECHKNWQCLKRVFTPEIAYKRAAVVTSDKLEEPTKTEVNDNSNRRTSHEDENGVELNALEN